MAPHAQHLRNGQKMGDLAFIDTMIKDGLWDAFNGYHMGQTAENIAKQWQITREEQDIFAVTSQNRAEKARKDGRFKDEIVPVTIKQKKGELTLANDEYIRDGATKEAMAALKPAFQRDGGTVTAANASGLNDGAAALVLMSAKDADKRGLTPLARIASWAQAGVDPRDYGHRPDPGIAGSAEEGGLEGRRSRSGGSQRGLRRAGPCASSRPSASIRRR